MVAICTVVFSCQLYSHEVFIPQLVPNESPIAVAERRGSSSPLRMNPAQLVSACVFKMTADTFCLPVSPVTM